MRRIQRLFDIQKCLVLGLAIVGCSSGDTSLEPSGNPLPPISSSVRLSWTPATENDDGSSLNDLAAYSIYYGTSSGIYTSRIRVDDPSLTSYSVTNLMPGRYFFVVASINSQDVESVLSSEVVADIP